MRNELIAVQKVTVAGVLAKFGIEFTGEEVGLSDAEKNTELLAVIDGMIGPSAADAARWMTAHPDIAAVTFLRKTDLAFERVLVARRVKAKAAPKARKPKKEKPKFVAPTEALDAGGTVGVALDAGERLATDGGPAKE